MAVMYPRALPRTGRGGEDAEHKVFAALRDGLSDEWEAFHQVSWVERDAAKGAVDGEIDFVVAHPDRGIVCLEVKGSGVECRHGEWSRLKDGKREPMEDPFKQALDHRYDLERKIEKQDGWRKGQLFLAHALCFPQITIHQLTLGPDAPREILIDRTELGDISAAFDKVLAYHSGSREQRKPPGVDGMAMLRDLLAPDVSIPIRLVDRFAEEYEQLIILTEEQAQLLRRMDRDPRMVIYGCAGSGKTMLAVKRAERLAAKGQRILFVCFNGALRDHLRKQHPIKGVDYFTFHGLCRHFAAKAKIQLPKYPDPPPQEYWDDELPNALLDATMRRGGEYDAVIVDEAQDLQNHWLDALVSTLRDEEHGPVWLFMDDNQRVYDRQLDVPAEFRPFELTRNLRNTQAIHREVMKLYKGEIVPEVVGPPGREIDYYETSDQAKTVASALERLCGKEAIAPQDVVVLTSHNPLNSKVYADLPGRWEPTLERGELGDRVFFSSVPAFKGLESPVVVLCELEDLREASREQQLYVALSRARNHCVVVAPE